MHMYSDAHALMTDAHALMHIHQCTYTNAQVPMHEALFRSGLIDEPVFAFYLQKVRIHRGMDA